MVSVNITVVPQTNEAVLPMFSKPSRLVELVQIYVYSKLRRFRQNL
jgi:hypothetical protein